MQDYMAGASQELYKLQSLPSALLGQTVLDAAAFIFDTYHAVLLAVQPATGSHAHRLLVADLAQVGCGGSWHCPWLASTRSGAVWPLCKLAGAVSWSRSRCRAVHCCGLHPLTEACDAGQPASAANRPPLARGGNDLPKPTRPC